MSQIPPDASVAATPYAVPPLSSRREIIRLVGRRFADGNNLEFFGALQLRNDRNKVISVDYVLADVWQAKQIQVVNKNVQDEQAQFQALLPILDQLITEQEYGLREVRDGALWIQKGVSSDAQALSAWAEFRASL